MIFVYPGSKVWLQTRGSRLMRQANQRWFRRVHESQLIYNTCWEDPRVDRSWMQLDASSKVLMITSAGCNALDYLLDGPEKVVCVDLNYRQNALLELKKAMYRHHAYRDLWRMFGCGYHHDAEGIYRRMRSELPRYASEYWDRKHRYFQRSHLAPSFYFQGTSGKAAYCFHQFLKRSPKLNHAVLSMLEADSLEDQERFYHIIEPILLNRFVCWLLRKPSLMAFLGVPRAQMNLINADAPTHGMIVHIKESLRQALTRTPIQDNYFWQVYIRGYYTRDCCPNYLKESHFETYRENVHKVETHTRSLTEYLCRTQDTFTHFVLLDHQDWLAHEAPELLEEEWRQIFAHAAPGAKVLMRSAAKQIEFLPDWVVARLKLDSASSQRLEREDRVGTYGCTLMATITS